MVRGINRTVIEINDTGSNYFERVILFVTPEYGNISSRQLKSEAERIIEKYYPDAAKNESMRNIYRKRKKLKTIFFLVGLAIIVTVSALLIFK